MSYKCEILADSINEQGHRLTTFKVTYPHIIHAEMLRHRMLSRNVASSRAIPFEKMVKMVEEDPFVPFAWQKIHKGMQGTEYFTDEDDIYNAKFAWLAAKDSAVLAAKELNDNTITKQLCNRLLAPFVWTTELVSGTEWGNFFELRCPIYEYKGEYFRSKKDCINSYTFKQGFEDDKNYLTSLSDLDWLKINKSQAEIHIQKIAEMMWDCYNESKPETLQAGDWHIPFEDKIELIDWLDCVNNDNHLDGDLDLQDELFNRDKLKISTARCARLSYMTFDGKIDYEADIKLHDRLLADNHMSPFEHCARAMTEEEYQSFRKGELEVDLIDNSGNEYWNIEADSGEPGWCNNYRGFVQYRYLVENQQDMI